MNEDRYHEIDGSDDGYVFTFISEGKNQLIKIVRFDKFDDGDIYNLGLGTELEDGTIDYDTINNNGDRNKLLTTVAFIVIEFLKEHPDYSIYIMGSDPRRTLLYQRAINYGYDDLIHLLDIYGGLSTFEFEPFDKNKKYQAFLIRKR